MALGMGRKAICVSRAYRNCALFCSLRADHEQTRTTSTPNQRLMAASCMMTTHAACTQAMRQSNTQTSRRESSLGRCQANARPLSCHPKDTILDRVGTNASSYCDAHGGTVSNCIYASHTGSSLRWAYWHDPVNQGGGQKGEFRGPAYTAH